jgi:glycerol-3-phosphate dehydrogenase (NAD(P)+)
MNVGIIGAGAWGTGIAHMVARGGNSVVLWSFDGEYVHFDGTDLPIGVRVTTNMADLESCDVWIAVTPAAFFRETMKKAGMFYKKQPIIICTKGAEPKTGKFMTEVLEETLKPSKQNVGVLSGPQFAGEVAHGVPTGSTLAGGKRIRQIGQQIFNKMFISPTHDVVGTEICGVGKNAVSVISGYIKVKGAGENESALYMTNAWREVIKIGLKMGAKLETFSDLCGIGDLLLTATSQTSRNFSAGIALAKGEQPQGTVEGFSALNALNSRAEKFKVHAPLLFNMAKKLSK